MRTAIWFFVSLPIWGFGSARADEPAREHGAHACFELVDLGTLPGGRISQARDLNNAGEVVGNADTGGPFHGFLWRHGRMIDLGTLGGPASTALAINDRGQVVGVADTANGESHAFLWEDGRMEDLGTLGGRLSEAVAVNARGEIAGDALTANGARHAALWRNGRILDLGTLGGTFSFARAINDQGEITGVSGTRTVFHAFRWKDGVMTDLGALDGGTSDGIAINNAGRITGLLENGLEERGFVWERGVLTVLPDFGGDAVRPTTLNDAGQVVGSAFVPSAGVAHAFLRSGGPLLDLGTLGGFSIANDINDRAQVVGNSVDARSVIRAFFWEDGVMTALPSCGTSTAVRINRRGRVAGTAVIHGSEHAVMWKPVRCGCGG